MKTALATQQFHIKKPDTQKAQDNRNKSALETIPASTAFSQLWKTLVHSEGGWKRLKSRHRHGEIEIPIAIQKEPAAKTENSAQTGKVTSRAQTNVMKAQEVPASAAVADAKGTNNLALGKVKQVSGRILDVLNKSHALPSVKAGDWAKVEVNISKTPRNNSSQNETNRKAAKAQEVQPKTNRVKTSGKATSQKIELIFKYTDKNGWQIKNKAQISSKNNVWNIRIIFHDGQGNETQSPSTPAKNKVVQGTKSVFMSNKNLVVTVLSAREIKKDSAGQKARPQMTVRFAVENSSAPEKNSSGVAVKSIQSITIPLNEETAPEGVQVSAKASAHATQDQTDQTATISAAESDEIEAQKSGPAKEENVSLETAVKKTASTKAGVARQDEWTALTKNQTKVADVVAKSSGNVKGGGMISSNPSALLERIESLMAQAAKSKNAANFKMQLTESPFGKLDVRFDDKENRLSIVVESEKAKEAFLRLTPLIQSNLANKGFLLSSVQVAVGESSARENREKMSNKRKVKNSNIQQVEGKEDNDHEITATVSIRKFGYNTLEVTA